MTFGSSNVQCGAPDRHTYALPPQTAVGSTLLSKMSLYAAAVIFAFTGTKKPKPASS